MIAAEHDRDGPASATRKTFSWITRSARSKRVGTTGASPASTTVRSLVGLGVELDRPCVRRCSRRWAPCGSLADRTGRPGATRNSLVERRADDRDVGVRRAQALIVGGPRQLLERPTPVRVVREIGGRELRELVLARSARCAPAGSRVRRSWRDIATGRTHHAGTLRGHGSARSRPPAAASVPMVGRASRGVAMAVVHRARPRRLDRPRRHRLAGDRVRGLPGMGDPDLLPPVGRGGDRVVAARGVSGGDRGPTPAATHGRTGRPIRIVSDNVFNTSQWPGLAAETMTGRGADVIVSVEMGRSYWEHLQEYTTAYPYTAIKSEQSILSRWPVEALRSRTACPGWTCGPPSTSTANASSSTWCTCSTPRTRPRSTRSNDCSTNWWGPWTPRPIPSSSRAISTCPIARRATGCWTTTSPTRCVRVGGQAVPIGRPRPAPPPRPCARADCGPAGRRGASLRGGGGCL